MIQAWLRAGAAVAAVLTLAGCGVSARSQTDPPTGPLVAVTTTILGDVVSSIVGDSGQVEVLMAPGQDPHGYAPSARDAQTLREADLVIANGLGLEPALEDLLEAAEEDGVEVLRVAAELDPLPFEEDHDGEADDDDHEDEADGHGHGELDPHVWFDPVRMGDAAVLIASHIAAVDPAGATASEEWERRGQQVADDILAAHDEVTDTLAAIPQRCRQLVTSHDSFGYLAARYDFEIIGTVLPGTSQLADPSAREFADLAATIRETGVQAIFAESQQTAQLSATLAEEVGHEVAVVRLHSDTLGAPGSGAETYTDLLRSNAQLIADALANC